MTVCLDCGSTAEVSHESNPSSNAISLSPVPESNDGDLYDILLDINLDFDEIGRTTWVREARNASRASEPARLRPLLGEESRTGKLTDSLPLDEGAVQGGDFCCISDMLGSSSMVWRDCAGGEIGFDAAKTKKVIWIMKERPQRMKVTTRMFCFGDPAMVSGNSGSRISIQMSVAKVAMTHIR
jgi:hypothetical protein